MENRPFTVYTYKFSNLKHPLNVYLCHGYFLFVSINWQVAINRKDDGFEPFRVIDHSSMEDVFFRTERIVKTKIKSANLKTTRYIFHQEWPVIEMKRKIKIFEIWTARFPSDDSIVSNIYTDAPLSKALLRRSWHSLAWQFMIWIRFSISVSVQWTIKAINDSLIIFFHVFIIETKFSYYFFAIHWVRHIFAPLSEAFLFPTVFLFQLARCSQLMLYYYFLFGWKALGAYKNFDYIILKDFHGKMPEILCKFGFFYAWKLFDKIGSSLNWPRDWRVDALLLDKNEYSCMKTTMAKINTFYQPSHFFIKKWTVQHEKNENWCKSFLSKNKKQNPNEIEMFTGAFWKEKSK